MMHPITQNRAAGGRILVLAVLLALLLAACLLAAKPAHASTTFSVNSTGDKNDLDFPGGVFDGSSVGKCFTGDVLVVQGKECTLRAAIQEANKTPGADTINFDIPGTGVATIAPASQLPTITRPVTINGYSQPGAKPNTKAVGSDAVLKIELSGASAPYTEGLVIKGANSTVKGLVINRWQSIGIRIDGSAATGNKVTGTYIGTDASGQGNLGNSRGMYIVNAPNNTIGGTTAGARNVISANSGGGVTIYGANATGNKAIGNYLGTGKNGTTLLGNYFGVVIDGAPDNTVGGTTDGAGNIISGNLQGVIVSGNGAKSNRILSNSIFAHGGLGIDLGDDGPTPNDPGDTDTGPNSLQNFPVISSARTGDSKTTIKGSLNSTPNKTFRVQFFSNPPGTDEGKKLIGQKLVTTNAKGNVTFTFPPAQKVRVGRTVTATATNPGGNTSEFSAPRKVVAK